MTRRPKSRRPPKLPDPVTEPESSTRREPKTKRIPKPRELLKRNGVSGCAHWKVGRSEMHSIVRTIAHGDPRSNGRLDVGAVGTDDVYAALRTTWGCTLDDSRARLDVDRTIAAFAHALERIDEVAAAGGRVIVATSRPASLLAVHTALVERARAGGARVLTEREVRGVRARRRPDLQVWWVDGVAVLTDGADLLSHDDGEVWREIDFAVGRAELVITDGVLGPAALAERFEVVTFADLHHAVLGVAAERGRPAHVVPAVLSRPAWCYKPFLTLMGHPGGVPVPEPPEIQDQTAPGDPEPHASRSTTPAT